jgi:molybdate transport system substrate-binding protein
MFNFRNRNNRWWYIAGSIWLSVVACVGSCWSGEGERVITVFAAASLTDVMGDISEAFTQESAIRVRFNFAGSHVLTRQIEAGAPADIFFPADEEKMDRIMSLGLVDDETRTSILSNRLIVVIPEDSDLKLEEISDLTKPEVNRIALANPETVPAGIYAKRYFESMGFWEVIRPKVIPTANVRAALAAVRAGNVDAGVVYRSDVFSAVGVKVIWEIPEGKEWSISYPVAVLKTAKDKAGAAALLEFMDREEAQSTFQRFGFELPADPILK